MRVFKVLTTFLLPILLAFALRVSGGRYNLGNGFVGINVDVLKATYPAQGLTTVQGTVNVVSNTAVANSNVSSAYSSTLLIYGMWVQHSVLVGKAMTYIDLTHYTVTAAHVVVTLTQTGTYGQGGYQIINHSPYAAGHFLVLRKRRNEFLRYIACGWLSFGQNTSWARVVPQGQSARSEIAQRFGFSRRTSVRRGRRQLTNSSAA